MNSFKDSSIGERRPSESSSHDHNHDHGSCHHGDNLHDALEKAEPKLSMIEEKLIEYNVDVAHLWHLDGSMQNAVGFNEYEKLTYEKAKKHHHHPEHGKTLYFLLQL